METNVGIICDSDISSQKESDDDIQACSMFFILLDGTEIPGDSLLKSCKNMALTIPPRYDYARKLVVKSFTWYCPSALKIPIEVKLSENLMVGRGQRHI